MLVNRFFLCDHCKCRKVCNYVTVCLVTVPISVWYVLVCCLILWPLFKVNEIICVCQCLPCGFLYLSLLWTDSLVFASMHDQYKCRWPNDSHSKNRLLLCLCLNVNLCVVCVRVLFSVYRSVVNCVFVIHLFHFDVCSLSLSFGGFRGHYDRHSKNCLLFCPCLNTCVCVCVCVALLDIHMFL